jgi:hypothetical protein
MVGVGCRAETDWQRRTKRSGLVLTVRLSAAQGLALRLGLSNDSPKELNFERRKSVSPKIPKICHLQSSGIKKLPDMLVSFFQVG